MRKQFVRVGLTAVLIITPVLTSVLTARADESSPWITSALNWEQQAATTAVPSSLNGNIDCYRDTSGCAVQMRSGTFMDGSLRLNSDGAFRPVLNYIENRQQTLAVPNSDTLISYTAQPVYGFYLYFNHAYSLQPITAFTGGANRQAYKISEAPDGQLADKNQNRLAADSASMSFSSNSEWMVVTDPNVATLRVNMQTFEALPFATGFQYGIGLPPDPKTAISEDGRYAVVASKNQGAFKLYDLSTCGAVPATISGPVNCQSRDLKSFMLQKDPGFISATNIRFLSDDTLSFYGSYYDTPTTTKTARFLIGTGAISSQIDYLALGDSYISGEGAFDYQPGTDNENNTCHLSLQSYPYLINRNLSFNNPYPSVACSGAITDDITNTSLKYIGQADRKEKINRQMHDQPESTSTVITTNSISSSFLPGYIDQLDFVKIYQPKAVTLSIGGNDIGFSKILMRCIEPDTCYSDYEDRVELVREINNIAFPRLVETYQKLKAASAPDTKIYIIGYPQIAKPGGDCADNVRLSNEEVKFSQQIIAYLDSVLKAATEKSGVKYVDVQDAFDGHRLCETNFLDSAMNGITAGDDRPFSFGPIGAESYHPTALGYKLLEDKILSSTSNLSIPMPAANISASPPPETGLDILNAPKSERPINAVNYDDSIANNVQYRGGTWKIVYKSGKFLFKAGSKVKVILKSEPVLLGEFEADQNGDISEEINASEDIPIGYHTLHLYGTDITGQPIDIQKIIYISDPPAPDDAVVSTGTEQKATSVNNEKQSPTESLKNSGNNTNNATYTTNASSTSLQDAHINATAPSADSSPRVLGLADSKKSPQLQVQADNSHSIAAEVSKKWKPASLIILLIASVAVTSIFRKSIQADLPY
jgi:hypothetical protein